LGRHSTDRTVGSRGSKRALASVIALAAGLLVVTVTPGIAPSAAASVRTPFGAVLTLFGYRRRDRRDGRHS